jgi:thiol-disulfide isomerase/thioredoxin
MMKVKPLKIHIIACIGLLNLPLAGCEKVTQINETLVKVEDALKGNSENRKEKLFGGEGVRIERADQVKYDDSKLSDSQKELIRKILNSNPDEEILREGTLCNEILFEDTSNKLLKTLRKHGYGEQFSFEVGVTALPEGTPGNMMWRELWKIKTQRGRLNYPMVFIEDGQGGAFFIGLEPYNDQPAGDSINGTTNTKDSQNSPSNSLNDMSPNFFNSIKPLLSKNNSRGRIRHTILYFSASWCGPCQTFTPMLAQWYKKMKADHPEMEIVFVSSDRSKEEFDGYSQKMPWAHLAFEHKDNPEIREHAAGGIPFLMLINEKGTPVTEKKHPTEILPQIESFITGKDTSESKVKMGVFN